MSALTRGVAVAVSAITGTCVCVHARIRECVVCVCACENLWVVLSQLREFLVVWSEVVAPLTDAVSLVNDES